MNKDIFYIDDLASIRAFCTNSDKEDVYKYIYYLQQENKQLKNRINKIDKHVSSLSSVGRGCEIYADVKREILKVVRGNNDDK